MNREELGHVAGLWAQTLDGDDFETLPDLMSATCVYDSPSGRLVGRDLIVDSYRTNSEWAHSTFDEITWLSAVVVDGDDTALITFTDLTRHRQQDHRYRCQQRIWVSDGLVQRIEHIEVDGESEALVAFFTRVGVTRPTD